MYRIAICDDNVIQQEMLKDQIGAYANKRNVEIQIGIFNSGQSLLDEVKNSGGYDIYILDIIMNGMKGTDVAKQLRECGDKGYIMFFTATNVFQNDLELYQPASYILKIIEKDKLVKSLDEALKIQ